MVSNARPPSAAPVPTAVTSSSVINSCVSPSHQLPGLPLVSSSDLVDTVVQGSVAATQSALSGELPVINPVLPAQLFSSPSLPIDARVSDKLRSKIWNNEFIEFGVLLTNPIAESKYQVTISSSARGPVPSLCLEPVNKSRKILSIATWLSCFHVFVGMYTSRFPHESPALMKYGEVVQDLAFRGFNWQFYDEIFVFFGRRSQHHSLGAVSIGSCGCEHNTPPLKSLSRNRSLCSQKCTIIFLLRGTALSLIGVYSVLLAVILNISVLSVMVFIRLAVVIFVLEVDPSQSSLSLPSPCMPSPSPQHLSLPTPVQVD